VLCLTVLSLCSLSFAAGPAAAKTNAATKHTVNHDSDTALKKIYTNYGPGNSYDANNGYFVSGINNGFNAQKQDIAIPFTPKKASHATKVTAALQYYNFGGGQTNAAVLAIYKDASGLPGKNLASKLVKNFDDFGTGCCNVATWKLATPLALKKGVQYWVVGTTNKKSADAISTWDFLFDDHPITFAFQQNDGGWILLNASFGYTGSSTAVLGTIP
jgi:hypothetical protein